MEEGLGLTHVVYGTRYAFQQLSIHMVKGYLERIGRAATEPDDYRA